MEFVIYMFFFQDSFDELKCQNNSIYVKCKPFITLSISLLSLLINLTLPCLIKVLVKKYIGIAIQIGFSAV